jgi:tRNA-2-methylthio-N6-dimethylallyladenosine synthase
MNSFNPKKYFIKTFGCQANVADSNTLSGILDSLGFEEVVVPADLRSETEILNHALPETDILIINTCSVRQKSEDKVYGLGKILKNIKKDIFVIMAGCMVGSVMGDRQRYEFGVLKKKTPWVDLYMNPSQVYDLPDFLLSNNLVSDWAYKKFDRDSVTAKKDDSKHTFVNISQGCDNFCTFCVVPYARGSEISRSEKEILREIEHFVKRGITEVTLCGQNVNSWGLKPAEKFDIRAGSEQKLPFADLLRKIHQIPEIRKIDFISSNPFDFTLDLIDVLRMPKISDYLHIAVQSGNNDILKKMNRRHTVEEFKILIDVMRKAKSGIKIGTDLIVGFPGETEEQFMDTVNMVKEMKFKVAYISMYSARKGTNAEKFFPDNISLKEKKRRHALLTKVWKESVM